ncbi:NADP-dependent oxidoreductase [Microbacterium sp. STN6]|uniref:NADP-dependent oxidoreductase n=1 Tax=Microbacterium sp. STN6 TaxID=2995588 RepID=UPI002260CA41|nr:NADP-dependent oxidoreductase [Microbacterium sp. STN6]MCX7520747.1 NADP-dependent oxidoreductase [Microbacterium sp. STN6]
METAKTMRAVVIDETGDPSVLRLADVPVPLSVNAEFLIEVHAAALNPIDVKTRAGRGVSAAIENYPAVLGHDFSGVVIKSPYAAHPIQPGDEVFGMVMVPRFSGSFAEVVAVPSLSVARKPASLSHAEAAGVPLAAMTAWGPVVELAEAHEGQRILIHAGSGGVGHFAVQFARHFGAHVVTTASGRNAEFLRGLGASEVIDYTTTRFEDAIEPVDVVIDLIGNVIDDTGSRSLKVLKPGGLIVNVPTGSWPGFFDEAAAAGVRATDYKVAPDARTLETIAGLLSSGEVRVHIEKVYDLADAAAASTALEGGHTRGKIALRVR